MSAPSPVTFSVAGHPQGKGRARFVRATGRTYTPEKTRSYEGMIRFAAQQAMNGREPFSVPVVVDLSAIFCIPASWSKKNKAAALTGELRPGKKPDLSNIVKAFEDACNSVVFTDDSLIVQYTTLHKSYGPSPMVVVTVRVA